MQAQHLHHLASNRVLFSVFRHSLTAPPPPARAYKKGTRSSKKKKQAKLKRTMTTLKKQARRGLDSQTESFAAVHLLHDPQVCG